MKIVILDGYTENPGDLSWEEFKKFGNLTIYERTSLTDEAQVIERIGDAEIVFTNKTPITKSILDACPNIQMIGVLATGYNVVDCACAREKGIPVANVPAYGTACVSQYTIALLLEICHHIGHHSEAVRSGRWSECADFCFWDYPLIELAGKTIGIIGFGRIGQAVGRIAKALGMNVLAYNHNTRMDGADIGNYVSLDELFAHSDVISLHCNLTEENMCIINKSSIAKMKDGVILLNTARGQLLCEQAVADALNSGKLLAAGLDVLSSEPADLNNPLLHAKNCFITPHIAWAPKESRQRIMECSVANLEAFLSGKPQNIVNM